MSELVITRKVAALPIWAYIAVSLQIHCNPSTPPSINWLQIYHWVSWWQNFENRVTFGGSYGHEFIVLFFDSQCSFVLEQTEQSG